ncbi:GMC family oxidoreductase [Komagataeibacter europaeus]|uniref:GMC family oxidoreductase n=1 Tax=Komagataeibacter europaeus TaxID=33995 RepID=UPI0015F8DCCB|nr:GMC family oxidoreductase [Komagataeibacter europaeus]
MNYKRPKADVVIVGLGWSGSTMAEELTRAGLKVVAIERGAWRDTSTSFPTTRDPDELSGSVRKDILQAPVTETYTVRNKVGQTALPMRKYHNLTLGNNVGGAGTHWAGASWRWLPFDHQPYSHVMQRYGAGQMVDGLILQDWGVTYDDLEPFYDRFEKIAGTSGTAGVINGQRQPGGNPFEGSRTSPYPTPALERSRANVLFAEAATRLGYHPFPVPSAMIGAPYKNALGLNLAPCTYCGYCQLYGCGNWSKSSPNICILPVLMQRPNFTVVTECEVIRINTTPDRKMATGVTFVDSDGNTGEQPADIVITATFTLDNTRLLLLSGISTPYDVASGQGVVGRAFTFQTLSWGFMFFENEYLNPFMNTGALATQIDDFNGDNFDHTGLGFIGGAGIQSLSNQGLPIGMAGLLPQGSPQWGKGWKQAFRKGYQNYAQIQGQGTSFAHREQFLDLDPTYKDRFGQPLLRITFDYNENDRRSGRFIRDKCVEIAREMGATQVGGDSFADRPYSGYTPWDSSHVQGGVVMGEDPRTSVQNRFQQNWDIPNLFVIGASSFPNNAGYNPTVAVGATTLWTAKAIRDLYLKNPGPLVRL